MTIRERVLTSRLIEKIDMQGCYSQRIGLGYDLGKRSQHVANFRVNQPVKKENNRQC